MDKNEDLDTSAISANDYIKRETFIGAIVNGILVSSVFCLMFGVRAPVPVWGMGQFAFDFVPQTFIMVIACSLVASMMAKSAKLKGKIGTEGLRNGLPFLPKNLFLRCLLIGVTASTIVSTVMAMIFWMVDATTLNWSIAFTLKASLAVIISAIATNIAITKALNET